MGGMCDLSVAVATDCEHKKPVSYIMIDIEADGPIPGDFSMICFGAVVVELGLSRTFYGRLKPIWLRGISRDARDRLMFIADNNGFDWQFINWYFHHFTGSNPFGFSSTNLGSLYKGLVKDTLRSFKHLRRTRHTHNPVGDAIGNAEALLSMRDEMGLNIKL